MVSIHQLPSPVKVFAALALSGVSIFALNRSQNRIQANLGCFANSKLSLQQQKEGAELSKLEQACAIHYKSSAAWAAGNAKDVIAKTLTLAVTFLLTPPSRMWRVSLGLAFAPLAFKTLAIASSCFIDSSFNKKDIDSDSGLSLRKIQVLAVDWSNGTSDFFEYLNYLKIAFILPGLILPGEGASIIKYAFLYLVAVKIFSLSMAIPLAIPLASTKTLGSFLEVRSELSEFNQLSNKILEEEKNSGQPSSKRSGLTTKIDLFEVPNSKDPGSKTSHSFKRCKLKELFLPSFSKKV